MRKFLLKALSKDCAFSDAILVKPIADEDFRGGFLSAALTCSHRPARGGAAITINQ